MIKEWILSHKLVNSKQKGPTLMKPTCYSYPASSSPSFDGAKTSVSPGEMKDALEWKDGHVSWLYMLVISYRCDLAYILVMVCP